MDFASPTNDIAFKKLFGNTAKKEILISFLNSVLERPEGQKIVDIIFNDPYNTPETKELKLSIVDVAATDEKNNHYIIEVQVNSQPAYGMRAQYYTALAASRELNASEKYGKLTPVIFVGVLGKDFELFSGDHYLSHHLVLDTKNKLNELKLMEWHFIELRKFNLELDQLKTIIEKWAYLLKNAQGLHEIPKDFEKTEPLKQAFHVLNHTVWSKEERRAYEIKMDEIMSARDRDENSQAEAIAKGKAEGKHEQALATAQAMLIKNFEVKVIADVTGLSPEEVEAFKKND